MVVMLWIVVFVVKGTFRTIPTVESYGAGVFCSRQNPYSGYAVKPSQAQLYWAGRTMGWMAD